MDVEQLIGTMLEGALLGGSKRSHRTRRFMRSGSSPFLNASTLLTVGGLVWGAIETMQRGSGATAQGAPAPQPSGPVPAPALPRQAGPALSVPPPLPVPAAGADVPPAPDIPEGAARIVRLMVSAARADGNLTEDEQATILEHARAAGAESLVAAEIARPTPLARIVEGLADEQQRKDLYVLAYGIVRADEAVSGSEQIFLAQLGSLLGLDRAAVAGLEQEAAARIDAEG
jgi:uncharacterized membrane protein YebE (DUF533 family)